MDNRDIIHIFYGIVYLFCCEINGKNSITIWFFIYNFLYNLLKFLCIKNECYVYFWLFVNKRNGNLFLLFNDYECVNKDSVNMVIWVVLVIYYLFNLRWSFFVFILVLFCFLLSVFQLYSPHGKSVDRNTKIWSFFVFGLILVFGSIFWYCGLWLWVFCKWLEIRMNHQLFLRLFVFGAPYGRLRR